MGLDVSVALIGTPEKGDTVLIGLEDGRSISLSFGTTISSNQWEILSPTDLPEVNLHTNRAVKMLLQLLVISPASSVAVKSSPLAGVWAYM